MFGFFSSKSQGPESGKKKAEYVTASTQTPTPAPEQHPDGENRTVNLNNLAQEIATKLETVNVGYGHCVRACSNIAPLIKSILDVHPKQFVPVPHELSADLGFEPSLDIRATLFELDLLFTSQFHSICVIRTKLHLLRKKMDKYRKSESDAGECSQSEFDDLKNETNKLEAKITLSCSRFNETYPRYTKFENWFCCQAPKMGQGIEIYNMATGNSTYNGKNQSGTD